MAIIKIRNQAIDLDAAEIPNLDASKITTGELANARVADLPTSKVTSGTFADARIASSNVTQHVTDTDLQPIKSDLTALALREATNEASAAFNLPNQFIETFATDVLGTKTDVVITSGHASTNSSIAQYYYAPSTDYWTWTTGSTGNAAGTAQTFVGVIKSANGSNWTYNGSAGGGIMNLQTAGSTANYTCYNIGYGSNNGYAGVHCPGISDCNTTSAFGADATKWIWLAVRTSSDWTASNVEIMYRAIDAGSWTTQADSNGGTTNHGVLASGIGRLFRHASHSYTADADNTHVAHMGFWNTELDDTQLNGLFNSGAIFDWDSNKGDYTSSSNLQEYFKMQDGSGTTMINDGNGGNATKSSGSGSWNAVTDLDQVTVSATGTAIQAANTVASAKTKVGGTMLYKDNAGTATLGSANDLAIYFTCNGGTNWTEAASYNAITPVYSTGIKQVRLGETTCTSGTDVRYKAVWANQSGGSKETQLHGIGINY